MRQASEARKVAVVVNAASRRGAAGYERAVELLGHAGVPVATKRAVASGSELSGAVEQAVADGHDLVVVGGGDGSVGGAAGVIAGTEVALGVLPLGTANDFARTVQVPSELEAACETLAHGKVVDIDLGRVDGRAYVNVALVGLSVGVTRALTAELKRRLGPVAYPVAALRAYAQHQPFSARLEFPGSDLEALEFDDLLQVAVGNGRHYGGGNTMSPTAGIDDDLLDVYAIVRGRLWDHVSIARLLKDGTFIEHERVHHLTTRQVRLVTEPSLPVNLDGEIVTNTPSVFEIERNAVNVVVPQHATSAAIDGPRARRYVHHVVPH